MLAFLTTQDLYFSIASGLLFGLVLGYLLRLVTSKRKVKKEELEAAQDAKREVENQLLILQTRFEELFSRAETLSQEFALRQKSLQQSNTQLATAKERIRTLETQLKHEEAKLGELLQSNRAQFENLARQILEENSQRFSASNQEKLGELLQPFQQRISDFKQSVEKNHSSQEERFIQFNENLKHLRGMNDQLSQEAQALTKALRGDVQTQGAWGEMILEKVLEKSGLVAGEEYTTQQSVQILSSEANSRARPDVIVHLPDERHLIIDSKVSLTAFERHVNAQNEAEAAAALGDHIASLHGHLRGISRKQYQEASGLSTLDFILVFIPIEAAFNVALQRDTSLYDRAFEQNIVIVTPSTLLATLRVVGNLWRQEKQNKNALEIATKAGQLYDKIAAFLEDMDKLKMRLEQAQNAFDDAQNKLQDGRGNILSRTENLKALGAKASKQLPESFQANETTLE